jgi:hypothetical protein
MHLKHEAAMTKTMPRTIAILAAMLLSVPLLTAASKPEGNAASFIEGIYDLQEWHTDAGVLKTPQIYGHFVVLKGTITTVLHNGAGPEKTTIAGIGHYSFDANGHFSYAYDNSETITENSSGLKVDRKLPWTGEKVFTQVESTPTSLRIKTADGGTEFYFTKTSFAASDNGKPLRSYKRVTK